MLCSGQAHTRRSRGPGLPPPFSGRWLTGSCENETNSVQFLKIAWKGTDTIKGLLSCISGLCREIRILLWENELMADCERKPYRTLRPTKHPSRRVSSYKAHDRSVSYSGEVCYLLNGMKKHHNIPIYRLMQRLKVLTWPLFKTHSVRMKADFR